MSTENQIHLKGDFLHEELVAHSAISPGYLLTINSDGEVLPHGTEGGWCAPVFAEIDALQGHTLADDYAAADPVMINVERPGNRCQAFLKAGEVAVIGSNLISAGDGTLILNGDESFGTTVHKVIAIAMEAEDLSGSGAVDTLIEIFCM